MKTIPVSVVIPCYCCADVLLRAINSIFDQTLLPKEIILIDDASVDDGATRACIENIVINNSINLLVNIRAKYLIENLGAGGARNVGMGMSSQPFLAFLDSDDAWTPNKLEVQYSWMCDHPEYTVTCHGNENREFFFDSFLSGTSPRYKEINKIELILRNSIQTSSVMMCNEDGRRFPEAMRYAEDYWLWLHLKFTGVRIVNISMKMSCSYKNVYGESGLSANLYMMHKGVLRCYLDLRSAKLIGFFMYIFACSIENLKYCFRIIITVWNKMWLAMGFR